MTDYKEIKGKTVLNIASDLDNAEGQGEIWFNTTSGDFKTIVKAAGAWASGGNLNTAKRYGSTAGTQTAGLYFGGSPGSTIAEETEEYNGSAWTAGGDLTTGRATAGGTGVQTAALCIGSYPSGAIVEAYDGSSWSEGPDLSGGRHNLSSAGTTTAALGAGGNLPPSTNVTEEWDLSVAGANWDTT